MNLIMKAGAKIMNDFYYAIFMKRIIEVIITKQDFELTVYS